MIAIADVIEARQRLNGLIHQTPLLTSTALDRLAGANLFFKCEHLQKAGSFKSRGATNAVFSLSAETAVLGVATHSSGNHGAALARAAAIRQIPAHIVVPENANPAKVAAIEGYGGKIVFCKPNLAAREAQLKEIIDLTDATVVHPYDDDKVIAGQGTTALEVLEQMAQRGQSLDALVAPVGGGGLLAGSALVFKSQMNPSFGSRVFGAEPEQADDAYRSFISGTRVTDHQPHTIADGLRTTLGERNFSVITKFADDIFLVSESEIVAAMRLIWTRLKQLVEPSSAVTLAAVLKNPAVFNNRNICVVLTGGNVDLADLPF